MRQTNTNRFLYDQMHPYVQGKKTLDIGCGDGAYSSISDDTTRLDKSGRVNPDMTLDLESADLPFKSRDFACVLMLDVLQHLTRERGERALRQAKSATSGRIYALVPMWNDPKEHQSSWSPDDFKGWTRIEFGNYFFGYWDYDPNEVVEAEEPVPQKEEPKSAEEAAPQKVDPKGAEIRSSFGYKTDWDY